MSYSTTSPAPFTVPAGNSARAATRRCRLPFGFIRAIGVCLLALFAITALGRTARAQTGWINEFHYDNDGSDTDEFVEIVVESTDEHPVSEYTLYLINGSDGSVYDSIAGDLLTEGTTEGLFTIYTWMSAGLQNGDDGIALAHEGRLLHFISYEGPFTGSEAPVLGVTSTTLEAEETPTTPAGLSLQLTGSGSGVEDFQWIGPEASSPGTANSGQLLQGIPLEIVPRPVSAAPGDTLLVTFILGSEHHPVTDVIGAGFQMSVDTSMFDILDLSAGDFLTTDTLMFRRVDAEGGTLAYSITTTDTNAARTGTGTLASSHLHLKSSPSADTTVTFHVFDLLITRKSGAVFTPITDAAPLTIQSSPVIELSDTTLDVGLVDLTTTALDTFTVRNTGGDTLEVTDITSPLNELTAAPSSFTLAAGESQQVVLSFRPPGDSAFSEAVTVHSSDPENPSVQVTVEGKTGAVVWPGDTDNNGTVDAFDVLPIGQHFGRTGPERETGDLAWRALQVVPWTPLEATYADATGDGLVSQNDLQPVGLNYKQQRTAGKAPVTDPGRQITIRPIAAGTTFTVDFTVPVDRPVADMLGLGIELAYPADRFEVVGLEHHLGADESELLVFEHIDDESGVLDAAYTRKRKAGGITGTGTVLTVSLRALETTSDISTIALSRAATSSSETLNTAPAIDITSDASQEEERPSQFVVHGNYPNPFNSTTTILLDIPDAAAVDAVVYDILGRAVLRLPTRNLAAGFGRRLVIDAHDLASGTYFYHVRASSQRSTHRATGSFTLVE